MTAAVEMQRFSKEDAELLGTFFDQVEKGDTGNLYEWLDNHPDAKDKIFFDYDDDEDDELNLLDMAFNRKNIELAKTLVEKYVFDPTRIYGPKKRNILHTVIADMEYQQIPVKFVKFLVNGLNVDPTVTDSEYDTPLDIANRVLKTVKRGHEQDKRMEETHINLMRNLGRAPSFDYLQSANKLVKLSRDHMDSLEEVIEFLSRKSH